MSAAAVGPGSCGTASPSRGCSPRPYDVERTGDDATNDHYVQWPKSVWAGQQLRLDLLAQQGLNLAAADLGKLAHSSPPDDIIDAAACAWTARRVLLGQHRWLPEDAPKPARGAPGFITY